MSSWRIVTRALYELGAPATAAQVELQANGMAGVSGALQEAADKGLMHRPGSGHAPGNGAPLWALTDLGRQWAEGRVRDVRGALPEERARWNNRGGKRGHCGQSPRGPRGRGIWFAATWLAALPRGVRIEPGPLQLAAETLET